MTTEEIEKKQKELLNTDTSNNNLEQEQLQQHRMKLLAIDDSISIDSSMVFQNSEHMINEWTLRKQLTIEQLLYKLKYNRAINDYFFFDLKSKENFWSWTIIVISTLTTSISLLNNLETEPFIHFFVIIKVTLLVFSVLITLIAAWIKKQQYIERINLIDRYNQKVNKLIEEIDVQLILIPSDRDKYSDFMKKYKQQITDHLSNTPAMSPQEWKKTVYYITIYYPELIDNDNSDQNKLWPWWAAEINKNEIIRTETNFGYNIKQTYWSLNPCNKIYNCLCLCCRTIDIEKGEQIVKRGEQIVKRGEKKLRNIV